MERLRGVGFFLALGLILFLMVPVPAQSEVQGRPTLAVAGSGPVCNGAQVILSGSGFEPNKTLVHFGAVARIELDSKVHSLPFVYRGFDLPDVVVITDERGQFSLKLTPTFLSGVRGLVQFAVYDQDQVISTEFVPANVSGPLEPFAVDATAGTLIFDAYSKGGSGEPHVANGDDVPLSSNAAGDWVGTLYGVNLERYTTSNGTGTPDVYTNLANDVTFSGGNLVSGSSAVVAGLVAPTYLSIRMAVGVWDPPTYSTLVWTTTTGAAQAIGWLNTTDEIQPQVSSATATNLTTIVVYFNEAVTTPGNNAQAIDNWTITFNGSKAVSALSPLGSSGTASCTLTVANLGDRGATPTVQFTTGNGEFEDVWGNDCAGTTSPHITASDGIAPATPTLTSPTTTTLMEGASMTWSANAGSGTDGSLAGLELQGSADGSAWDSLGVDASSPYGGTYTFGTQYHYYRCQAYDTNNNTANSSATPNLHDANHLHLTTIPAATQANVESDAWTVTVHDNYGNSETVTQTVSLSTTSSWGYFRAVSSGPSVTYINIMASSYGNFYYVDSQVGNPWIFVVNVALADDSTQYEITANTAVSSIKIRAASGGGGSEIGNLEIAGAPNGGSYNSTQYMYVAGYNSLGEFVTDVAADWSVTGTLTETGGSGFENFDPTISNLYTAITSSNRSGRIVAEYNGYSDSTGTVTVDATRPAIVQGFNITGDEDQSYVNATWSPTSSYDDGNNASSGNVADFDIRFAATIINTESAWNNATSVGTAGKPSSFNGSSSWRIYMAGFPAGYYFYAIKTLDPQGYWSLIGWGCYTTSPDYSLPVTLSSFYATGGYGKIFLSWSSESEIDALGYRVLRSEDEGFADPAVVAGFETNPELLCQGSGATGYDYSYVDGYELQPEMPYYYRLESVDINGRSEIHPMQAMALALPLPTDYSLGPNFPNPFNPRTQFDLRLPQSGPVTVTIYDLRGREVARLLDDAQLDAGIHRLTWNSQSAAGVTMPSGLYLCRLQAPGTIRTLKMMLTK
jgi:hypothetical protein